jgi:hypothetical protein
MARPALSHAPCLLCRGLIGVHELIIVVEHDGSEKRFWPASVTLWSGGTGHWLLLLDPTTTLGGLAEGASVAQARHSAGCPG